jgi:hypothetical protein
VALTSQSELRLPTGVTSALSIVVGTLGTFLLCISGTVVGALPGANAAPWWFQINMSHRPAIAAFYLGTALLVIGWAGLGSLVMRGVLCLRTCWVALVAWGSPLVLGPPLFSRDLYSYVAQGLLAKSGKSPYTTSPAALADNPVYLGIASVWRHTPAPYGPLSVLSASGMVRLAGRSLSSQVMVMRLPEILGMVLLMVAVPRLTRRNGADPVVGVWLAVLSPLSLISFIASGHNEGLMLGIMLLGALAITAERYATGFALGAAAATVKLPALSVVAFPLAQQLGQRAKGRGRLLVLAIAVPALIFCVLTVLASFGWGWLSPSALSIPTHLRTLATPSVALGVFLASTLHVLGSSVSTYSVVTVTRDLVTAGTVVVLGSLLWCVRHYDWVRILGIALVVLAVGSPTLWPWYFTWGLCVLATTTAQRWGGLALVASVSVLLVGAQGTPSLTGHSYLLVVPALAVGLIWLVHNARWRTLLGDRVD